MRALGRTAWLAVRLLLLGALSIIALLACAVYVLIGTPPGRSLLADQVSALASETLAGTVHLGRLSALGPGYLRIEDVILKDTQGNPLVTVDQAEVHFAVAPLLRQHVDIRAVRVQGPRADLSGGFAADSPLIQAIAKAQPTPDSEDSGGAPWTVLLRKAQISAGQVQLPDSLVQAPATIEQLDMRGYARLTKGVYVRLQQLAATVQRDGQPLLERLQASGHYDSQRNSAAHLILQAGDSQVDVEVRAEQPFEAPMKTELELQVDGESIAVNQLMRRLGKQAPLPQSAPPLSVMVRYRGSLYEGEGRVEVESSAGSIRADLRRTAEALTLNSSVERLSLRSFVGPDVPAGRLSLSLRSTLGLPQEFPAEFPAAKGEAEEARYPLTLQLPEGRFAGQALPAVSAQATLHSSQLNGSQLNHVNGLQLSLHGSGVEAHVRGDLQIAPASTPTGQLDVEVQADALQRLPAARQYGLQGQLKLAGHVALRKGARVDGRFQVRSAQLQAQDMRVSELKVEGTLAGTFSRLSGDAEVQLAALHTPDVKLHGVHAKLRAQKGTMSLTGRTRMQLEHGLEGSVRAAVDLTTSPSSIDFNARASGRLADAPLQLKVTAGHVDRAGTRVRIGRLQAQALGVALGGRQLQFSRRGPTTYVQADLVLDGVDLAELSRNFALMPAAAGTLAGELQIAGPLDRPELSLSLQGRGLQRANAEPVELDLQTTLARSTGEWSLKAAVERAATPLITTAWQAQLPRARSLLDAVRAADYDASLRLDMSTMELVQWQPAWIIPLSARTSMRAELHGQLDRAQIQVLGELLLAADADGLQVAQDDAETGEYQPVTLSFSGEQTPERGSLDLSGNLGRTPRQAHENNTALQLSWEHPRQRWLQTLQRPQAWLEQIAAKAHVQLRSATMAPLAQSLAIPQVLADMLISAEGDVSYDPQGGPQAQLAISTVLPRPAEERSALPPAQPVADDAAERPSACSEQPLRASWKVRLQDGQLALSGSGQAQARNVVAIDVGAAVDLRRSPRPLAQRITDLQYTIEVDDLAMRDVPQLCTYGSGNLNLHSTGRDLLGPAPNVSARLHATQLRSGGSGNLDIDAELTLDRHSSRLEGHLNHAGKRSPWSATLPIQLHQGSIEIDREGPVRAQLRLSQLELEPLFGARSPISQAKGQISADVAVRGTWSGPQVAGKIHLQDVAFTASALSQPISGLSGDIELSDRRVRIPKLSAQDQGGHIGLSGEIILPTARVPQTTVDFDVEADRFPIRSQGQIAAEASVQASVDGVFAAQTQLMQVRLQQADVWLLDEERRNGLSLAPHPDIVDSEEDQATREPPPADTTVPFKLELKAQKDFWVKRNDFAVNLDADLQGTVERGAVAITGGIDINRGYVQLLGQTFDLQPGGTVSFLGGQPINPALDLTAEATARRTSQVVTVNIGGRARAPQLAFQVDGQESTVGDAMLVLLGQTDGAADDNQQEDLQGQASSFVTGMLGGLLAVTARRELGAAAPILMIDTGKDGNARVRAGFELGELVPDFLESVVRGVYLEGMVGGSDTQSRGIDTGVLLELYFPYDLIGSGQYGPGNTWSLDLGWDL